MLSPFILCGMPVLTRSFFLATLMLAGGTTPVRADDPCLGFRWDVRTEHALFATDPKPLVAGTAVKSAPRLRAAQLYALTLAPQASVAFAAAPGRDAAPQGSYAGLAVLELPGNGDYRIALDLAAWVDVVVDGKLAPVVDFQGQRICDAPHKIVEFDLTNGRQFVLQISGAASTVIRATLTPSQPRTVGHD